MKKLIAAVLLTALTFSFPMASFAADNGALKRVEMEKREGNEKLEAEKREHEAKEHREREEKEKREREEIKHRVEQEHCNNVRRDCKQESDRFVESVRHDYRKCVERRRCRTD